jgi:hypothetical protein
VVLNMMCYHHMTLGKDRDCGRSQAPKGHRTASAPSLLTTGTHQQPSITMSLLSKISKGPIQRPHFVGLYGLGGVGKSTFGASAPKPIFLGTDDGTGTMDVARFPVVETWAMAQAAIDELQHEKHEFETVVIDTVNGLEPLLWAFLCREHKCASITDIDGGFGQGYIRATEMWVDFFRRLKVLRQKMNVIVLGHASVKTVDDVFAGERYDRYLIKMHQGAAAVFHEAVECMFFATFETSFRKEKGARKAKAFGEGRRIMFTEERPGFMAKSRYDLPACMELSYSEFARLAAETKVKTTKDEILSAFAGMEEDAVAFLVSVDRLREGQTLADLSDAKRKQILNRKDEFVAAVQKFVTERDAPEQTTTTTPTE